jgi:Lar family restriction alleviation protein
MTGPTVRPGLELLPCPFCGAGPARGTAWGTSFSGVEIMDEFGQPFVMCGTCGAQSSTYNSTAEAITAWNTRPALAASGVEEMAEALNEAADFVQPFKSAEPLLDKI